MLSDNSIKYHIITSTFKRANGYREIESTITCKKRELIRILSEFTPQGASPSQCIRIRTLDEWIGISYFYMKDPTTFKIMVLLTNLERIKWQPFLPLIHEKIIPYLAGGDKYKLLERQYNLKEMNIIELFGLEKASILLYSLLSGDNIVFIHSNHKERLKFIISLLQLVPSIIWSYNCITSNCEELDGNENIVGVKKLPSKYFSHKKLHLPLDTIFVDLNNYEIHGVGIKHSELTKRLMDIGYYSPSETLRMVKKVYYNILNQNLDYTKAFDDLELSLIHRIEAKLDLREPIAQDWMMF